jgi:DNA-binding response OmpR family regulator
MHILLADDDESIGMVARLALRKVGYEVTWIEDGTEALAAARRGGFDALLLDWMLPGMDGIDICRAVKSDPATAAVPVVFLTAASHQGAHEEALAAGAVGVIAKPFNPMELGARVQALIGPR